MLSNRMFTRILVGRSRTTWAKIIAKMPVVTVEKPEYFDTLEG